MAIVPNIGTAIKIHGDGGWRIQFDIDASQEAQALELLTMRGKLLRVTVEEDNGNSERSQRKSSKVNF